MGNPILAKIRELAVRYSWAEIDHQENIYMISFSNGSSRINVYYSKMTVATVVDHPKLGRQTLYRKGIIFQDLEKIFKNPRVHLGTGYRRRTHAGS